MFRDRIKDVFFDLDHTLWDFDSNSALTFKHIFSGHFPEINLLAFNNTYPKINQDYWKLYQNDQITHDELKTNRLKKTFELINHPITTVEIEFISTEYIKLLSENTLLLHGAIETLDYLKPNYNLHIITNGFADVQQKKIQNSNLEQYFITVTNADMAGAKKPHAKIYEYALAKACAKKESSLMIGDCLDADVKGAINAGLQAIFFNESKQKLKSDIISIHQLTDLKQYL
jgi:putative hydrolase of the HAD superfamily